MKRKRKSSPKKSQFLDAKKSTDDTQSGYKYSFAFVHSDKPEDWYQGKSKPTAKAHYLF